MPRARLLFLERAAFRRRRLEDATRLLPVLAIIAVILPVWWLPGAVSFARGATWIFSLWAGLILATAALHLAIARADRAAEPPEPPTDPAADDAP